MFSNLQASLRESWLDDMMHVLEGEALGQDAATVEAAFKRHEAISTDVKARVSINILLGSLSEGVFERRTTTGSGRFSFWGSGCALIFK